MLPPQYDRTLCLILSGSGYSCLSWHRRCLLFSTIPSNISWCISIIATRAFFVPNMVSWMLRDISVSLVLFEALSVFHHFRVLNHLEPRDMVGCKVWSIILAFTLSLHPASFAVWLVVNFVHSQLCTSSLVLAQKRSNGSQKKT